MGECGCDLRVDRCRDHADDVVLVLSAAEFQRREGFWQALTDIVGLENWQGLTAREIASKALQSR